MAGDLYFDKTVLLLQCNGTDASTTFTDSSLSGHTVTPSGDAQIDTAQSKYGGASALFDGNGDYLSVANHANWNFGTGDFTIEAWVRRSGSAAFQAIVARQVAAATGLALQFRISSSNTLQGVFRESSDVVTVTGTTELSTSAFTHVAICRQSGVIRLFVAGTQEGSSTACTYSLSDASQPLRIGALYELGGAGPSQYFAGWIDDLRITKGVARYWSTFEPPTGELPASYQLAANDSTEAHSSPGVVLKNLYCPPISQANQSPAVAITLNQDLTAGSDAQANTSTGGNLGIVSSLTINLDTRSLGSSGLNIVINCYRSGTSSLPIAIYGDLVAEANAATVTWRPKCVLNGSDISALLVGVIEIETEEMAAPVASFSFLPAAGSVDPLAWVGTTVALSWQRYVSGVLSGERLRFTGIVSDPVWDADQRSISISATGDLQSLLDRMDKTAIASQIGGTWSDTVFGDPADLGGWDYAESLLSTTDAVVWQDASGAIRLTSTLPKVTADYTFEDSGRFEQSLRLDYASRVDITNRISLSFEHRFKRRRERRIRFRWRPPELETPCHYLTGGYPLPQRSMIESAANGGGYTVIGNISYTPLWPGSAYRCMTQDPATGSYAYTYLFWVNTPEITAEWCIAAAWTAAKRWTQTVTEEITLEVNASESQATVGVLQAEETYTVESEADDPTWESSLDYTAYVSSAVVMGNGVDRRADLDTESRAELDDAEEVALAKARAEILKSHRGTSVTFQTVYQPMLDLSHTVEVDCAALECQGKVRRIADRWDIDSGDCTSEIEVALFRHNGAGLTSDTPLAAVTKPADPTETVPQTSFALGFHVGGTASSPLYDTDWEIPGSYITNYPDDGSGWARSRSNPAVAARVYDEGFKVTPPDIDDEYADPVTVTAARLFEVAIPEDALVLTSY